MDLKTFVSKSISEICNGIIEAQDNNPGAVICPIVSKNENGVARIREERSGDFYYANILSFDVSVTAEETGNVDGKGEIKVLGVSIGGGASEEKTNQSISRLQFTIPIVFPRPKK